MSQRKGDDAKAVSVRQADRLGAIDVPGDKLWGAQTQRSLQYFSIGKDLIPRELIGAYAILKEAAAAANHRRQPSQQTPRGRPVYVDYSELRRDSRGAT